MATIISCLLEQNLFQRRAEGSNRFFLGRKNRRQKQEACRHGNRGNDGTPPVIIKRRLIPSQITSCGGSSSVPGKDRGGRQRRIPPRQIIQGARANTHPKRRSHPRETVPANKACCEQGALITLDRSP